MELIFTFIKFNYFSNKVKPKTSTKLKFQVCTLDFGIDIGPTFIILDFFPGGMEIFVVALCLFPALHLFQS